MNILEIIKCIYGLVQDVRPWFKEYIKDIILKIGLNQCKLDPCLLYRVKKWGLIISLST